MCQNLYSTYGATETTTVAIGPASVIEAIPGAVGYVLPGVTVEVVDNSGMRCRRGTTDRCESAAHHMVATDMSATRKPPGNTSGTAISIRAISDISRRTELLVITGREKTALNIGGDTVSPESVEAIITAFAAVAEAGVFAVNNSLGIAELSALIVARSPIDEARLREHCARRLPTSCVPVRFIVVDALPRVGQGKIERHRLPEIAAAISLLG